MQNVQSLTGTNGVNKYVCKYVGNFYEGNKVVVRSNPHDAGRLVTMTKFLHNTKISSSAINEKRAHEKSRDHKHPSGRAISEMEMIQVMLKHPQVHTDMEFDNIPTVPLELRAGVECKDRNFQMDR